MKGRLPKALVILIVGVFSLTWTWLNAESQSKRTQPTPPRPPGIHEVLTKHSARPPVVEFGDALAESGGDRRQRRGIENTGRGFYKRGVIDPGTKEVNGQTETLLLTFNDETRVLEPGERPDPPGIPVSSSAIVRGTVISGKTVVSEDRTYVHTDYKVRVSEVLKSDPANPVSAGDQITAWVTGGSVRFPSGHVKHFIIVGRGFPEIGAEYLFFLRKADSESDAFSISTAYGLKGGSIQPLDDRQDAKHFEEKKAADFLDTVRSAIADAAQTGGRQQ